MIAREKVEDVLLEMGMPSNIAGFKYIIDAIEILSKDETAKTTWVYQLVANKHTTTVSCVERAIRHALQTVRTKGNVDAIEHYIGFKNVANASSLHQLLLMVRRERNR